MMRKGQLALKTLEILAETALSMADVVDAILTSPYGSSYGRLDKRAKEIRRGREGAKQKAIEQRQVRDLFYRLSRDGLIAHRNDDSKLWQLTVKGKHEWMNLKKYFVERPEPKKYKKEDCRELNIVVFDVPEKYKLKRNWLRAVLKNLGFTALQKSVLIGKCKLPQEFLEDIYGLGLLPYIEIFVVTKTGSLKEITRRD